MTFSRAVRTAALSGCGRVGAGATAAAGQGRRWFAASAPAASKIGRLPLTLPPGVSLKVVKAGRGEGEGEGESVVVTGPLGELALPIPEFSRIERVAVSGYTEPQPAIRVADEHNKHQRAMWGTTRALINRNIVGVSEGHTRTLTFVGVGYRASVEPVDGGASLTGLSPAFPGQRFVSLKVGYGHPIELPVPAGVRATAAQPTKLLVEGADKEVVADFAANIQSWRMPEPYKGKGIFIDNQKIKLKAKKIK